VCPRWKQATARPRATFRWTDTDPKRRRNDGRRWGDGLQRGDGLPIDVSVDRHGPETSSKRRIKSDKEVSLYIKILYIYIYIYMTVTSFDR